MSGNGIRSSEVRFWIRQNFCSLAEVFNATSSVARLVDIHPIIAARLLYVRFEATCGDAMGMNMVSRVRVEYQPAKFFNELALKGTKSVE